MGASQMTVDSTAVANKVPTLSSFHAGRTGDVDNPFLKYYVIALGWTEMGDMSALPPDRGAFRARMMKAHPDRKGCHYWIAAGQVFHFIYEGNTGDLVIYPSRHDPKLQPEPLEEAET